MKVQLTEGGKAVVVKGDAKAQRATVAGWLEKHIDKVGSDGVDVIETGVDEYRLYVKAGKGNAMLVTSKTERAAARPLVDAVEALDDKRESLLMQAVEEISEKYPKIIDAPAYKATSPLRTTRDKVVKIIKQVAEKQKAAKKAAKAEAAKGEAKAEKPIKREGAEKQAANA